MSDAVLRDAARLLRSGAPMEVFIGSLDGPTRIALALALRDDRARRLVGGNATATVEDLSILVVTPDGTVVSESESTAIRHHCPPGVRFAPGSP